MSVFADHVHEHELIPIALAKRDGVAMKMTDVVSQDRFERTGLFNEFYRSHGLSRQLGLALPVAADLTVSCAATRGGKDFTERDRAMMSLAAPHLLNAMRNAIAYGRLDKALESGGSGIVALDSNGRLVFANDLITGLIAAYFPHDVKDANGLPETVTTWMGKRSFDSELDAPIQPLLIEGRAGVLKIRLMVNTLSREQTLIFEEKRLPRFDQSFQSVDLTKREAEILFWITNGKTNAVIAEICSISMRTVQKHVEHIYQKLGVETRTAAMLRGLEVM
jgi:DNA-binding CsgD family transcriptional regulator